jgi:hypothetical protein
VVRWRAVRTSVDAPASGGTQEQIDALSGEHRRVQVELQNKIDTALV